ncbi:MAG: signal peptide peptidase SppA [Thermodesulfobacteriota bacterium]
MTNFFGFVANIFKWIGKSLTVIRHTFFNLLFLFIIFAMVSGLIYRDHEEPLGDTTIVTLSLEGDIVEQKQTPDSVAEFIDRTMGDTVIASETLLQDILDVINNAAKDDKVGYLLLDVEHLDNVGLDQLQVIGDSLTQFRLSGKKIIAAENFYKQSGYYLASFADEIILNPLGGVDLHGLGAYRLYFREALDRLGVNYHIFRVGTYKSALEPIMRNSMSDEAREQNRKWLTALWQGYTNDVTDQRKLSSDGVQNYVENIAAELAIRGGNLGQSAKDLGLVDELKTISQMRDYLSEIPSATGQGKAKVVSFHRYLDTITPSYRSPRHPKNNVAIIVAQGTILGGDHPPGTIGAKSITKSIRRAKTDPGVKALVLRIRSGGGSVMASEIIRQELLEFKKSNKPLVVSMGTMAASGGYWISADADEIWASPSTLTGSIGIFAAIPTFEKSLSELGIHSDGLGTTSIAAGLNVTRPLSPTLKESTQLVLEYGYRKFLNIVAKGRDMDMDEVKELAQGRVYDGKTALDIGLVDKLGTLQEAIDSAAAIAKLDDYSAVYLERPPTFREELFNLLQGSLSPKPLALLFRMPFLKEVRQQVRPLAELLLHGDPSGLYALSMLETSLLR